MVMKILYGSQSGTAEKFAQQLRSEAARSYNVRSTVVDLDTYIAVRSRLRLIFCKDERI